MRKIGELKGKPIIEGNPNEIKKNQIHYKESDGSITLSERKGDNTLSSVTSGSGSGEGVKEYYYRFKDEYLNTNIHDILIQDEMSIMEFLHMLCGIEAIICPISKSAIEGYAEVHPHFVLTNKLKMIPYFKFIDSSSFMATSCFDDKTIPSDAIIRRKGNISDRVKNSSFGNEEEDVNFIIEVINTYIQEITKEEYESMITYKPE